MQTKSEAEGTLVVGALYPKVFDLDRFVAGTKGLPRAVKVITGHYEDTSEVRTAKRRRADIETLRSMAAPPSPATCEALAEAEVVLALDVPVDVLSLAPRLRLIQASGAGVGQFDDVALLAAGVQLTTAAGVGVPPIAEFVIARVLEVWKRTRELEDLQKRHLWQFTPGRMLSGCTIGIVGFGAIGTGVAQRAKAFGMRVLATRLRYQPGMTSPVADELYGPDGLGRLLEQSDVVVLAAPATPETDNLIGAAELALMKEGSVLCNVARGTLLDEGALVAALANGRPQAAILDVAVDEPLPPDSVLWDIPNLYLSPHSSASQDGYFDRLQDLFAENVGRYARGEDLINLVTADKGY